MRRDIFTEEHELFREQFRRFAQKEIEPKVAEWNARGMSDRESWRTAGAAGFLGACAPVEYGGAGGDFLYDAIIMEETRLDPRPRHDDLAALRHLHAVHRDYGSPEQKQKYLPGDDLRGHRPRHRHDRAGHRLRTSRTCRRAPSATAITTS